MSWMAKFPHPPQQGPPSEGVYGARHYDLHRSDLMKGLRPGQGRASRQGKNQEGRAGQGIIRSASVVAPSSDNCTVLCSNTE